MNLTLLNATKLLTLFILFILSGSAAWTQSTLWTEDFESCATNCSNTTNTSLVSSNCVPSGWLTKKSYGWIGTSQNIRSGSRSLKFLKNQTGWIMTGGASLVSGTTYELKFWYRIPAGGSGSGAYKIEVGASTSQTSVPGSLTTVLNTGTHSTEYTEISYSFTAPSSATYYFGLKTSSGSSARDAIIIDDIALSSLCTAASITAQSTPGQSLCLGSGSFDPLTVTAAGTSVLYQWYSNTTASTSGGISMGSTNGGQTSTFIPPTATAGTKYYYCIVSGACDTVISSISGAITVNLLPVITDYSPSKKYCENETVLFTVTPSIEASYNWQWSTSPPGTWTNLSSGSYGSLGYLTPELQINSPNTNLGGGTFSLRCVVTENGCSTNSTPVTVSKAPAGPVVTGLSSVTVCTGQDVVFSVTSVADNYSWQFDNGSLHGWTTLEDDTKISGSNTNSITISDADMTLNGISFRCIASEGTSCPTISSPEEVTILSKLVTEVIRENNFDDLGSWTFTVGTPEYTGTGEGDDDTGIKIILENKVLCKSFSANNGTGGKSSTNTVSFENISGLGDYAEIDFEFQVASLGVGTGAGNDAGEDFKIEYSTDNGTTWYKIHEATGNSDLLFGLAVLPVAIADTLADTIATQSQFRLHLEDIDQFRFRFTATNNRTNENWAIDNVKLLGTKAALKGEWGDLTQKGTVTFQYANACSAVGPYHYIISEVGMISMKDSYRFLKDSIFDGVLDSISFFQGTESLLTHTFTDLPMGNYHIGVFDSRGETVLIGEQFVGPAFVMVEEEDVILDGNKLISTGTDSKATFDIFATEASQGNMELELTTISGQQTMGFLEVDDIFNDFTDLKNGFYVDGDKVYTVKDGVLSSSYTTVSEGSILNLSYRDGTVIYEIDRQEVDSKLIPGDFAYRFGAKIGFKKLLILEPIRLYTRFYSINKNVTNASCSTAKGSVIFKVNLFRFGSTSFTYTITGISGTVVSASGNTSTTYTQVELDPGIYTISITSGSLTFSEQFSVEVDAGWLLNEYYNLFPTINSLQHNNTNPGIYSKALSTNILASGTNGSVQFTPITSSNSPTNYFSFQSNGNTNTDIPGIGESFLFFTRMSSFPFNYFNFFIAYDGVNHSFTYTLTALNAKVKANLQSSITFQVNGAPSGLTPLTRPAGNIRLKANSDITGNGFQYITTTYGCGSSYHMYAKLEKTLKGVNYPVFSNTLRFYYDEEYTASSVLKYKIYDKNNAEALSSTSLSLAKEYGDNRYDLNVTSLGLGTYLLEVTNEKNEKFYLRFSK